ncbi:MAG: ComEC/Rec2 family competence protein, partial [Elusimicrobiota bacterium]|nr:ComEC/Rec2 family competence protein [Elusimicrobiota bacterium]
FILGAALALIFLPGFDVFVPLFSFSKLLILHWILIFTGALILIWVLLGKYRAVTAVMLLLIPVILGAVNYWRCFNTHFPDHISHHLDKQFWDKTGLRGTVVREPDERADKTNLFIKPFEIKKKDGVWRKLKGRTGNVLVQVKPVIGDYYKDCEYGDIIEVESSLMIPMEQKNPGSFDYKEYLQSMFGTYACMYPRQPGQVKKIGENSGWLLRFALDLKKKMICIIKETIPYPQSAFLGGVTLGTRGGVPPQMKFEFQATGVAHVLSVSGLHAGFIAALFFAICSILRIPPKPRWFVVTGGLIMFTLITGARPATMRASLMYSMLVLFNTFGLGLKASTSLTIPVTAVMILSFDLLEDVVGINIGGPLLLPSASFVLSYVAVWSLCYLTGPVEKFFDRFVKSWMFIVFFFWVFFLTAVVCLEYDLLRNSNFLMMMSSAVVLSFFLASRLHAVKPLDGLAINRMPPALQGLVAFFYAQFAIQIGMMIPLSAAYFHRFPAAGVYANFIAIPLIGLIVMAGFLAGLIGALFSALGLPALGSLLALYLNAGNYWLCVGFTGVAHFFFKAFTYPFMPTFSSSWLIMYYSGVLLIAFHRPVWDFFEEMFHRLKYYSREELYIRASAIAAALILIFFLYGWKFKKKTVPEFKATIMAIGFGNCNIIRTPGGKSILVDTTISDKGGFNFSGLAAAFTLYHIGDFDAVVLTNLKPENTGNAAQIFPYFRAKKVFTSYEPSEFVKKRSYQKFLDFLADENLKEKWDNFYAQALYRNYYYMLRTPLTPHKNYKIPGGFKKFVSTVKGSPLYRAKKGDIIYSEKTDGKDFIVSVLWPPEEKIAGTNDDLANNSIVLKIKYGDFVMIMPSDIMNDAEYEMLKDKNVDLNCDVLIAPYHGHMDACLGEWFEAASPSLVVMPYSYQKGWSFSDSDIIVTRNKSKELGAKVLRTDKYGAVEIASDGKTYKWTSVKTPREATQGEASNEDSLDVF